MQTITETAYIGEPVLSTPARTASNSTSMSMTMMTAAATSSSTPAPKQCTGSEFWCTHELLIGVLFAFACIAMFATGLALHYLYVNYYKPRHSQKKARKSQPRAFPGSEYPSSMDSYNKQGLESGMPMGTEHAVDYGGQYGGQFSDQYAGETNDFDQPGQFGDFGYDAPMEHGAAVDYDED